MERFEQTGFDVRWGLDSWKPVIDTFKANHPQANVYEADIGKVSDAQFKSLFHGVHVIVGGPPCQGFSSAGKRALDDPRNKLVKEYIRAVKALRPQAFVIENVKGFTDFNKGALLHEVIDEFDKLNYNLAYDILDAVNYGVPQRRKRFFLIGVKDAKPKMPEITHSASKCDVQSGLEAPLTFWDAVSDLPLIEHGEKACEYLSEPHNPYQKRLHGDCAKITLHEAPNHKRHTVELIKHIPQGKSAFDVIDQIPEALRPTSGFKNSYKRLKPDEPAPTITRNFTTPSSANCIHPFAHRALTLREGARIQSFPDSYRFVGSFTDKRLLIGNAVPPLLSMAIAKAVASVLG